MGGEESHVAAAAVNESVLESISEASLKGKSADDYEERNRNKIVNAGVGVELVRELNNGRDEKEKVGSGEGRGGGVGSSLESALKFTYRPSMLAHRRIKESSLSLDAIFRQVFS
ncbi:hypothetical protein ACH5RR_015683 [Cinchona calisaya]|uniref:Uncharacterized protein n=1 Tax=Cinchona calisaya TaxID=153742 RepID=A0ABD2ZTV6_9GENT